MTRRPKTPVRENPAPEYPDVKDPAVQRRRFMALLGGGAAAALLGACGATKEDEYLPLPGAPPNAYPPKVKPEQEHVKGKIRMPDKPKIRGGVVQPHPDSDEPNPEGNEEPESAVFKHVISGNGLLEDGTTTAYEIGFECPSQEAVNQLEKDRPQMLRIARSYLATRCDYHRVSDSTGLVGVNRGLKRDLAKYLEASGCEYGAIKFTRIKRNIRKKGTKPHPSRNQDHPDL